MIVSAPSQLIKGIQSLLIEALMQPQSLPIFDAAATYVNSNSNLEDYAWLGEVAQVEEFVDEVQFESLSDAGGSASSTDLRLTNKKFTGGLEVLRDNLMDETTGGIRQRINDLTARAMRHVEAMLVLALTQGDVSASPDQAGGNSYDGVTFFNATHTARGKQSSTQSNLISYSGSSTANAQTDLAASVTALQNFLDEAAEPLNEGVTEMYVIYPPALHKPIAEAITAQTISQTTNVQFSGLNWNLINAPRLTSHSAAEYYVGANVPGGTKALIYQDREPVSFEALETGDTAFTKEVYRYKVRKRAAAGYGRWQRMVRVAA